MARIIVTCAGAGWLAENMATVTRIRGALGRRLHESASAAGRNGGPCTWQPPCAWDVLFNEPGHLTPRLSVPAPFVIALDPVGADLAISLTLFGMAVDTAGEVAAALVESLRIGLDEAGDRKHRLELVGRSIGLAETLPLPAAGRALRLDFLTPVALRQGQDIHADPASLILSLGNRVAGLALWHGARLTLDATALMAEASRLGAGAEWRDEDVVWWQSGSQAQGKRIPMAGLKGTLILPAAGAVVTALLTLGAECHAGARTTKGQGRYRLFQT